MPLLGDVFINTVYAENVGGSVKTTDHPIEGGESITDHVEKAQKTLNITGIITGSDASIRKSKLERYRDSGKILKYSYRNVIENIIITDFNTTHDAEVKGGLKFDMNLKVVKIVKPMLIKGKTKHQTAAKGNKGLQQPKGKKPVKIHVVKSGDSLSKIAAFYGVTTNFVYDKNRGVIGKNKDLIYPGQKLII